MAGLVAETVGVDAVPDPDLDWRRYGPELATVLLEAQLAASAGTTDTDAGTGAPGTSAQRRRGRRSRSASPWQGPSATPDCGTNSGWTTSCPPGPGRCSRNERDRPRLRQEPLDGVHGHPLLAEDCESAHTGLTILEHFGDSFTIVPRQLQSHAVTLADRTREQQAIAGDHGTGSKKSM